MPTGEALLTVIGILVSVAFGGWAAVVKRSADKMEAQIALAVGELSKLREEIHRDRLQNERRFARLEQAVGFKDLMRNND